jgi:plasmid replication initiation protein
MLTPCDSSCIIAAEMGKQLRKDVRSAAAHADFSGPLAVLHNELARAQTDLGLIGLRLIMLLVGRTNKADEFLAHRLRISDYRKALDLTGDSAYSHFRLVVRKLLTTIVETKNPVENSETEFQVLSRAKYWKGLGEAELMFHEDMKPLLLNLKSYFTKIPLEDFLRIQGLYAARFYLFCKSWDPQSNYAPGWRMLVPDLRKWLGLKPGEYEEVKHIRSAILERARKELDAVADLSFHYDPVHEGKKIIGWDFIPVANKPKSKASPGARRRLKSEEEKQSEKSAAAQEASESEFSRIDRLWLEASSSQRDKWLNVMPVETRIFAPKSGARPGRCFLTALQNVIEPHLPGMN